jgi:hypothetical protein
VRTCQLGAPDPPGSPGTAESAAAMTAAVLGMAAQSEAPAKAAFFGAGKGGYGEGDQFPGVR